MDEEEKDKDKNSERNDGELESIILAVKLMEKDEHELAGKAGKPEAEKGFDLELYDHVITGLTIIGLTKEKAERQVKKKNKRVSEKRKQKK